MTLQQQVCTLEQAKRLKELGCEQNALCAWYFVNDQIAQVDYDVSEKFCTSYTFSLLVVDAYTVAELGEMLGDSVFLIKKLPQLQEFYFLPKGWNAAKDEIEPYPTEAEARAALLIYILEQKK